MSDIAKQLQNALEKVKDCDVTLELKSKEQFRCHSLVLRLGGDYFSSYFSTHWLEESKDCVINCSEFEDDVVRGMVKFLYGIECDLNESNIDDYLACASYFGVSDLNDKCERYLLNNLRHDTVFQILMLSEIFGLLNLTNKCLGYLDSYFEAAVNSSDDFQDLPEDLVISVIKRTTLSVHEELLFDSLVRWVLKNGGQWDRFIKHIRFFSMSTDYFVSKCLRLGILHEECVEKTLLFLTTTDCAADDLKAVGLSNEPRKTDMDSDRVLLRFPTASDMPTWVPDSLNGDRLLVSSNVDTKIKGVSIFGASGISLLINISVFETDANKLLEETSGRIDFKDSKSAFVLFKKCLNVKASKEYTFLLKYKGNKTYYGINGLASSALLLPDGTTVKLTFKAANVGLTNVERGQFHGFLLALK